MTPSLLDALLKVPRLSRQSWRRMGWLQRWLIACRAALLPLTLFSCLFGGLLALPWTPEEGARLALVTTALVLAHATSNLANDLVDHLSGRSGPSRPLGRLGAHPLARGLLAPSVHGLLLVGTAFLTLLCALAVSRSAGAPGGWLAGAGGLLMLLYAWPLRRMGLGEVVVFLVWGPLMVSGVYWFVSGDWGPEIVLLASIVGLGPTVLVLAGHADARRSDAARRSRTLAVLLGPVGAPRLMVLLGLGQVAGALVWVWVTGSWLYLIMLCAVPSLVRFARTVLRVRPSARPAGFPTNLWPLWHMVAAFHFTRTSGACLVASALLDGVW